VTGRIQPAAVRDQGGEVEQRRAPPGSGEGPAPIRARSLPPPLQRFRQRLEPRPIRPAAAGRSTSSIRTARSRSAPARDTWLRARSLTASAAGRPIAGPNSRSAERRRRSPTRSWCGRSGSSAARQAAASAWIRASVSRSTATAAVSAGKGGIAAALRALG